MSRFHGLIKLCIFLIFSTQSAFVNAQQTYWQYGGNNSTASDYLGSMYEDLNIISGGFVRMTLLGNEEFRTSVGIGTTTPNYSVQIHGTYDPIEHIPEHGEVTPIYVPASQSIMQFTNVESGSTAEDGLLVGLEGNMCFFRCMDKLNMRIQNLNSWIDLHSDGAIDFFGPSPCAMEE